MENTNIHSSVYMYLVALSPPVMRVPACTVAHLVIPVGIYQEPHLLSSSISTCTTAYLFESVVILSLLVVHYISKDLTDYTRICDTYLSEP